MIVIKLDMPTANYNDQLPIIIYEFGNKDKCECRRNQKKSISAIAQCLSYHVPCTFIKVYDDVMLYACFPSQYMAV